MQPAKGHELGGWATGKGIEAADYVVLCAFKTLEVWQPGRFPGKPRAVLDLVDLPEQYATLLFLTPGGRLEPLVRQPRPSANAA